MTAEAEDRTSAIAAIDDRSLYASVRTGPVIEEVENRLDRTVGWLSHC